MNKRRSYVAHTLSPTAPQLDHIQLEILCYGMNMSSSALVVHALVPQAVSSMAEHVRIESPLDALALAVADGRIDSKYHLPSVNMNSSSSVRLMDRVLACPSCTAAVIRPPWNVPVLPASSSAAHHQRGNAGDAPVDPSVTVRVVHPLLHELSSEVLPLFMNSCHLPVYCNLISSWCRG